MPFERQNMNEARERLWCQGREIVRSADVLYIDIDAEFDGKVGYGSLLSVGAITPYDETFYVELKPASELFIPSQREFCDTHGLDHDRLIIEGVEPFVAMHSFSNWVSEVADKYGKSPLFSGLNPANDWGHIDLAFTQAGLENPFGVEPFDIQSLMVPLGGGWNWANTAQTNLPPEIIPTEEFSHNALDDARYQQKLHFGLAALLTARQREQL